MTSPVATVATLSEKIDRNVLADFSNLVDFVGGQLVTAVRLATEDQVLNGTGTVPSMRGILATPGLTAITATAGESVADAVYRGIASVGDDFLRADAVVLNSADWTTVRLSKAATAGTYLAASIVEDDPPRVFGVPVVVSPLMAAGAALVGAFNAGSVLYQRETARVSWTEFNEDDFEKNAVTFRAEERCVVAVTRPMAFCKVDLTP